MFVTVKVPLLMLMGLDPLLMVRILAVVLGPLSVAGLLILTLPAVLIVPRFVKPVGELKTTFPVVAFPTVAPEVIVDAGALTVSVDPGAN